MSQSECMWCKGVFERVDGPTHAYMQSTPGCWAAYGRVLAREYQDQRYFEVHRLTVDSYAVQHPGVPGRLSMQSVGFHLVRLCLFMEQSLSPGKADAAMRAAARNKAQYRWLEPPSALGAITVADIEAAPGVDGHKERVKAWAAQMWDVWSPHHGTIRHWADASLHGLPPPRSPR